MKSKIAAGLAVSALLCAVVARPLWSGDKTSDGEDAAKAAAEKLNPGKEHEALAKMAGKWEVAGKFWFVGGDKPAESKGSAEFEMILGGRFLNQKLHGELMNTPYEGFGQIGFDRSMNRYTEYWVDSMGTGATFLTGTSADGGKTIDVAGKVSTGETGSQAETHWRHTMKSDDEFVFEMFTKVGAAEKKEMELTYTRKK